MTDPHTAICTVGESLARLGEAAVSAAASSQRLAVALQRAREQRERDAFWNHPGSVTT